MQAQQSPKRPAAPGRPQGGWRQGGRPARPSAKQLARARRSEAKERERLEREADRWMIDRQHASRDALDYEALAIRHACLRLVIVLVDWEADRCRCPGAEVRPGCRKFDLGEHSPGCTRPRQHVADMRHDRPGLAVDRYCRICEDPPNDMLFESTLRAARPGSEHPLTECAGCVYSYLGELEDDRSIVAAFAPRPEILKHLIRDRARRILERERDQRRKRQERRSASR